MIQLESLQIGVWFIFLLVIFLDAFADGITYKERAKINTKKESILKHIAEITTLFILFSFLLVNISSYLHFGIYLLGIILLRFAIFDAIYNTIIGQDYRYVGSTSLYDLFLKKFTDHRTASFIIWALKCVSLITSLAIVQQINNWF